MYSLLLLSTFHLQSYSEEIKGGLFDFNATLPLMALQFLVLTAILNIVFYKPVTDILNQRDNYIRNSLTSASASLLKADELTRQYESELSESRKNAQNIIKNAQQEAQALVSERIKEAQNNAETLLISAYNDLNSQKEQAFKSLETQVDILCNEIKSKLFNI